MNSPRLEDRISSFAVTFPNHTLLSGDTVRWITALGSMGSPTASASHWLSSERKF